MQFPDQASDVELWSKLQLDVLKGGTAATANYATPPLVIGDDIELGEHVKLLISDVTGGTTVTTDYKQANGDQFHGLTFDLALPLKTAGRQLLLIQPMMPVQFQLQS